MIIPNINLLIYAVDSKSPFHSPAVAWLEETLSGDEAIGFPGVVLFGFLRISTNSKIFKNPLSVKSALGYVREWLGQPCSQFIESDIVSLEGALSLLDGVGTAGNLVSDAQIAALAVQYGAVLHSSDCDFKRFPGLRTLNPLLKSA